MSLFLICGGPFRGFLISQIAAREPERIVTERVWLKSDWKSASFNKAFIKSLLKYILYKSIFALKDLAINNIVCVCTCVNCVIDFTEKKKRKYLKSVKLSSSLHTYIPNSVIFINLCSVQSEAPSYQLYKHYKNYVKLPAWKVIYLYRLCF